MAAKTKTLTGSPPADQTITTSDPSRLMGWSLREEAGTPAVAACNIREGSASGEIIASIELAANGSDTQWFGPGGVHCRGGIYFDVVAGEVTGTIYYS